MKYYALFLNNNGYVEKCLSVIRYIGNPNSKSAPHITLRLFDENYMGLKQAKNIHISYLNIIEPGTFNFEKEPPYTVYLRCESEELESIEYKPDYPFSRLHITLYKGNDLEYATQLYNLLSEKIDWHFKLSFKKPKKLYQNEVGTNVNTKTRNNMDKLFEKILNKKLKDFELHSEEPGYKLRLINDTLDKLHEYLSNPKVCINKIDSYYVIDPSISANKQIDALNDKMRVEDSQKLIHVTPPEYAREMAIFALDSFDKSKPINFGDSAIGTGALFLALKRAIKEKNEDGADYKINSAIGVDINKAVANEAHIRYSNRDLKVIVGDSIVPETKLDSLRNLMLVNPPYTRYNVFIKEFSTEYRTKIQKLAMEQTGIKIRGNASLYVYHMLIMDKWLSNGGVAVWLLPSTFLQTKYGKAVREYLLNNVQMIRLHVYDDKKRQFYNADVSTSLIVFKKETPKDQEIVISYGESAIETKYTKISDRRELQQECDNWRKIVPNPDVNCSIPTSNKNLLFRDLFDIKRGLATGANSFFVMKRDEAKKREIPEFALKPILPKSKFLDKGNIIESEKDGFPKVNPQLVLIDCDLEEKDIKMKYPKFYEYLQLAKEKDGNNKAIIDRTLVNGRHPWYKQEQRSPPPYLMTYMGRTKEDVPPVRFFWNRSKAVALNNYVLLYPRDWLNEILIDNEDMYQALLNSLNESARKIIPGQTRVYSGGLQKVEPGILKNLSIINLPHEITQRYHKKLSN